MRGTSNQPQGEKKETFLIDGSMSPSSLLGKEGGERKLVEEVMELSDHRRPTTSTRRTGRSRKRKENKHRSERNDD